MKLMKCTSCLKYTLKENCEKCKKKTNSAHYKFLKLKNAPKSNAEFFNKKNEFEKKI